MAGGNHMLRPQSQFSSNRWRQLQSSFIEGGAQASMGDTELTAQDIVPFLTIPGSIIGIITGAFVVWERLYRYRPVAYLIAKPLIPGGAQNSAYVHIVNRSDRPILLTWPTGTENNVMRIAVDHSTRAIVGSLLEGTNTLVVHGGEERDLPVMLPPNWQHIDLAGTIEIAVSWRFVQPVLWKSDRRIIIRIDKRSYQLLVDDDD